MSERNIPKTVTPLRQRMIEDMAVRNLSPSTQASYITAVKWFSLHHRRSPADLGVEDVRAYQVHLVERRIAWASLNQIVSVLQFFYGVTLGRSDLPERIPQTLTHHPHVHCIVPGGGPSPDGKRWIACRPGFFLPVRVLSRLYRRLFLERLAAAHRVGKLQFFNDLASLAHAKAFAAHLAPVRRTDWIVFAKKPFAGPEQVLAYLSRYTHRIAISNRRLVGLDDSHVAFSWRD